MTMIGLVSIDVDFSWSSSKDLELYCIRGLKISEFSPISHEEFVSLSL